MPSVNLIIRYNKRFLLFVKVLLLLLSFSFILGCSNHSSSPKIIPDESIDYLEVSGNINLVDIAVHRDLHPALIDYSPFTIKIEDVPHEPLQVSAKGFFTLPKLSVKEQLVVYAQHSLHSGFILEYMSYQPQGIAGKKDISISVQSTARSLIARCLREKHGRRIDPDILTTEHISDTVDAIAHVIETAPSEIANIKLEQVTEVKNAYISAAESLHNSQQGTIENTLLLLLYFAADNSLASEISRTIEELESTLLPKQTQIIMQLDLPIDGAKRLIHKNGEISEICNLGKIDSTNPDLLYDFVTWARRTYPAEKQILLISSHSDAWKNTHRNSLIIDDSHETHGIPLELAKALKNATILFDGRNKPLDLIVLDACNMGFIEIAYELKNSANYTVFSQAYVPLSGMPLQAIISELNKSNPASLNSKQLAEIFCEQYKNQYLYKGIKIPATISIINNNYFSNFINDFNAYLKILIDNFGQYSEPLTNLINALHSDIDDETVSQQTNYVVQAFEKPDYRDLYCFLTKSREITPEAKPELDKLFSSFDHLVTANYTSQWFFPEAKGLSIAIPNKSQYQASYFGNKHYLFLSFLNDTRWSEFLALLNE